MRNLTWAVRGAATVSVALLAGSLMAPSAGAYSGPDPKAPAKAAPAKPAPGKPAPAAQAPAGSGDAPSRRCETDRDVSSTVADYSGSPEVFETVFRTATDRQGHAFLNDSRNPGVWINLALVPGGPQCTYDTAVSVTEESEGHLFITLLGSDGVLYQATCNTSGTPFTPANLPAACAPGFAALADTPV
ncbi:hypothetical protein [Streptomyces sp. cmx-4-9]|uniref:hypothetical protein n=1 Tax=Streptomyces sp. cmx-4-9 TaxID=2790941 RepID=UPI0039813AE3